MKSALELDISECKKRFEEQLRTEEEALRTCYEAQLADMEQKYLKFNETLQERQDEVAALELLNAASRSQHEEQIEQLEKK